MKLFRAHVSAAPLKPLENSAPLKQDCPRDQRSGNRTGAKSPREEFFQLVRHLRERHAREWDQQIEEDNGKLREVYRRLETENQGQPEVPLDEFLDHEKLS